MADTFHCTIVTPEAQVLDEQVSYASIPAHDGQMGLANLRAPLLVKLGHGKLRLDDAAGKSKWFFIGGGFAQMKDNNLALLTDKAVPVAELNLPEARAELSEALAFVPQTDEQAEKKQQNADAARAKIDLLTQHAHG